MEYVPVLLVFLHQVLTVASHRFKRPWLWGAQPANAALMGFLAVGYQDPLTPVWGLSVVAGMLSPFAIQTSLFKGKPTDWWHLLFSAPSNWPVCILTMVTAYGCPRFVWELFPWEFDWHYLLLLASPAVWIFVRPKEWTMSMWDPRRLL